ncbi:MAG: SDR family oxidoreductase [Kiritimatiellae bacterium]|nr:SDR family oxidoreductase [Kiritimatiellia bacterium]
MKDGIRGTRVVVTGGAGFIGSNLAEALWTMGNEVACLDNFATGKRENLAGLLGKERFELVEGDIRDRVACDRAMAGAEYVFHEAALGSVPQSIADPGLSAAVNVWGTVEVLDAARRAGVKRVVYASSSAVYGDDERLPKKEDEIGRALSPYAVSKRADELYAADFGRLYGLETVGLRYFNVFGPRQDPHGAYAAVIPLFAAALLRHEAPTIHGDGSHTRDYTHVENVVRANVLAALGGPETAGEVYNVGNGVRTDLNELFAALRDGLAAFDPAVRAVEAVHGPERAGDIPHSVADISKARRELDYEPLCSVRDGLERAARWYFEHLGQA